MVTEKAKPVENYVANKNPKKEFLAAEAEFENLVLNNIPRWTAVWNMLLQDGKEPWRKGQLFERAKPMDLQNRIRRKISELVDKEETLVDLYKKAAEVAKKKEEEFKGKTAILIRQIEKDKNMMKMFKNVN